MSSGRAYSAPGYRDFREYVSPNIALQNEPNRPAPLQLSSPTTSLTALPLKNSSDDAPCTMLVRVNPNTKFYAYCLVLRLSPWVSYFATLRGESAVFECACRWRRRWRWQQPGRAAAPPALRFRLRLLCSVRCGPRRPAFR